MRYLVLGAGGQLGQELCPILPGEVTAWHRADADLARPDTLVKIRDLKPDVVFNCGAYNFVDQAELEPEAAFAVNAWGVRQLAQICADLDCTLVQFSTDHVFGLDKSRSIPYTPRDPPGPVNVYGLSKLAGEYLVRSICSKHFVIRTCGLYGFHGHGGKGRNFVSTMLRLANERNSLRIVADQICTPTYAVDLAKATVALVQTDHYGVHHITNASSCSWYEFACAIFRLAGLQVDVKPIRSDEYMSRARRPSFSVLATTLDQVPGIATPRPWQEALEEAITVVLPGQKSLLKSALEESTSL